MGASTKIQWAHHTFNPWRGCTKVSSGCANCYAETLSARNPVVLGEWGPHGKRVVAAEPYWRQPLKWDREAEAAGERRRVFCASLADVFEDREDLFEPRERLFGLIADTPHLDWLLLTKRPENVTILWPGTVADYYPDGWPHVWLGVSVEDQATADERIPRLLEVPAAVRFVSAEPLLGAVDLTGSHWWDWRYTYDYFRAAHPDVRPPLDWVIAGGESGPGARACNLRWVRSLVSQCREARVPCFVKQLGSNAGVTEGGAWAPYPTRDPKGGDPGEWPEDLRVRELTGG